MSVSLSVYTFCGAYSSQTAGSIFFIVVSIERQLKERLNRLIKSNQKQYYILNKTKLLDIRVVSALFARWQPGVQLYNVGLIRQVAGRLSAARWATRAAARAAAIAGLLCRDI